MDYGAIYDKLIDRARHRELNVYVERHHIIPKCVGGSDVPANLVFLTPEEHYLAHQLLFKMERFSEHKSQLCFAANMMVAGRASNKMYGWLRRRLVEHLRQSNTGRKQSPETVAKRVSKTKGMKRSPETIEAIRRSKLGHKRKPFSEEHIRKLTEVARTRNAMRGRQHSAYTKSKISRANSGLSRPDELKKRISEKLKGTKNTEETKRKKSIAAKKAWARRKGNDEQ